MNIKNIVKILRTKSFSETSFRIRLLFEKKTGLLIRRFPQFKNSFNLLTLNEWRRPHHYLILKKKQIGIEVLSSNGTKDLKGLITNLKNGVFPFFSKTQYDVGLHYDWVTNPLTGFKYDKNIHWAYINNLAVNSGDIKFVWELSRFSWIYYFIRNDYHNQEDNSDFVISKIIEWIDKNPLNSGPNYNCSQEISIRLNNWISALSFYKDSVALTPEQWNKIINSIYWQIDHVFKHINFSRKCVRNNHAITETLTLYLMGLIFPSLPNAKKWKEKGKKWFEKEIEYQIEEDGTYLQDSMNYHRVVIQLITFAIAIAEKNGERFSDKTYEKAYKSLNFLYQCQDLENGFLPNYGANDGALFFPLSSADYKDYRPQLDALHGLLTGQPLYEENFLEDGQWLGQSINKDRKIYPKLYRKEGLISFESSGFYLFREKDSLTFLRCGLFKKKGTNDQLHIDIWYKGQNIFFDGGSYSYNTDPILAKYFGGTESQNTLMLGNNDQMQKGPRFMWFYPPRIEEVKVYEDANNFYFKGVIKCFSYIGKDIRISREVRKKKSLPYWIIIDEILNKPYGLKFRQLWHTDLSKFSNIELVSTGEKKISKKWVSSYYGYKEPADQIEFSTEGNLIKTEIRIKE